MRFQMPFNSNIQVRLFEKVEAGNDCYNIRDIGLEYKDEQADTPKIDSIAVGYASQFHRTRPCDEIKKDVAKVGKTDKPADKAEDKSDDTPVSPTEVVTDDDKPE